jgi:hypothetical protein
MKRNLTIGIIVLFILSGIRLFAQDNLIKENRPVGSFSGIKISGLAHVYLKKAETEKVNVEINNKDYNDRLIVEVVNNVLIIRLKQIEGRDNNFSNLKLKIYVDYKNLNSIETSGVTQVYSENVINADKMDIHNSGVSKAKLNIEAKEINIETSGTSDVTLTGSTGILNTKSSGVSNIKAYDLAAQEVRSETSGASNTYVAAAKSLSAKASGASNVNYKGNPQITGNESSKAANIRKM